MQRLAYNNPNDVLRNSSNNPPKIPGKLAAFFNDSFAKLRRSFNRVRLRIGYRNQALPGNITIIVHAHLAR